MYLQHANTKNGSNNKYDGNRVLIYGWPTLQFRLFVLFRQPTESTICLILGLKISLFTMVTVEELQLGNGLSKLPVRLS